MYLDLWAAICHIKISNLGNYIISLLLLHDHRHGNYLYGNLQVDTFIATLNITCGKAWDIVSNRERTPLAILNNLSTAHRKYGETMGREQSAKEKNHHPIPCKLCQQNKQTSWHNLFTYKHWVNEIHWELEEANPVRGMDNKLLMHM